MPKNHKFLLFLIIILGIFYSCKNDNGRGQTEPIETNFSPTTASKISHVTFYIENSGSMYGYVNGATEFVEVVNKLAQYPDLVLDDIAFSYNLISGKGAPVNSEKKLEVYKLGNEPSILKSKLTKDGLRTPTSGNSDLNEMFKIALDKAKRDSISILISDSVYDVDGNVNPLNSLKTEVQSTTTTFIQRLRTDNIETLVIKLQSNFDGLYHPANVTDPKGKSVSINQKRPYYIWIFGNSNLLNQYFPESKLKELNGYVDLARFRKLENQDISFKAIGYNNSGFKLDFKNTNIYKLDRTVMDSSHFNIAVDFKDLKISDNYLTNKDNYSNLGQYSVVKISKILASPAPDLQPYLSNLGFTASHILSISTPNPPATGDVKISLINTAPQWIEESSTDNDYPFDGSTTTTFGFKTLIGGIEEAYKTVSTTKQLAEFIISIKN